MDIDSLNFTELRDVEIVARMRKCNYEKFKTLVRMHLSFELDLNTDEFDLPCHEIVYEDKGKLKKWNRLSKKHKHGVVAAALATGSAGCASVVGGHKSANTTSKLFCNGSPFESLHQQVDPGFLFHLQELKDFLMLAKNLEQEGIFRKTGSSSRQNELRMKIQNDKPLDLEASGYSAHDCATVFKGYLAELPEPLLTDAHYPAHLQIAPLCMGINSHIEDKLYQEKATIQTAERIKKELHVLNSIQLLLLLLPDENRQLFKNIIDMLHAVARQHSINKMCSDNLATLFTPHLICPRNLPPEALHYLAKKMSSVIAYMIVRGRDIFSVPSKLATDIRAYFLERKRKKTMSPEMTLDDSISDISTVNTVYTFVDREKTAAAHNTNTTDTELAQLYAHIQSLPESSKKRRLIKQFNKQNGQGTPLQLQAMNRVKNTEISRSAKTLSDSIKKHIFHKGIISKTPKRQPLSASVIDTPNNPNMKSHKQRILFQSPIPQTFATRSSITTISSLTSSASSTTALIANSHSQYNIKSHPLQKSISSSSLLMSQQYAANIRAVPPDLTLNAEQESLLPYSTCCNAIMAHNLSSCSHSSNDGFVCKTKSISAPASRQTSSDLKTQNSSSSKSASSSSFSSGLSSLTPHLEPNCCITPLKIISEAAKHFITSDGGVGKKSVAWHDDHLFDIEHISNPSTPLRSTNSNDLKSRYKSEPNLSMSRSICGTSILSNGYSQGSCYEMNTPIAKHLTGRSLTRKFMKGVSMGSLKFPFSTPESTKRLVRSVSSTLKKRRSSEDSQIYQQGEGSFVAAIRSSKAPLLLDLDANFLIDNSEDEDYASETEAVPEAEDNEDEDEDVFKENVCDMTAGVGSSSYSLEVANCFAGGPAAYQRLILPQCGLHQRNLDLVTSTPSLLLGRRSMSPITKSTQRMPKAMQESIMTPRSRKPVMVLTATTSSTEQKQTINRNSEEETESNIDHNDDDINDSKDNDDSILGMASLNPVHNTTVPSQPEFINENAISLSGFSDIFKRRQLLEGNQSFVRQCSITLGQTSDLDFNTNCQSNERMDYSKQQHSVINGDVLTHNFKEYLLTRSVLTAPPEDTSFTSHSDDFDSSHEIEEIDENQLSSSLLYCLNGNRPETTNDSNTTTTYAYDENDEDTNDTTHTNGNSNTQILDTYKTATTSSSSASSNTSNCNGSISSVATCSSHSCSSNDIPLVTTNRLANNPFVILNNARKRAASQDLDKISSALFNNVVQSATPTHTSYQTGVKAFRASTVRQFNSPNNKYNTIANLPKIECKFEKKENNVVTNELLINEYPGETSF